jgi:hypothetical protein
MRKHLSPKTRSTSKDPPVKGGSGRVDAGSDFWLFGADSHAPSDTLKESFRPTFSISRVTSCADINNAGA